MKKLDIIIGIFADSTNLPSLCRGRHPPSEIESEVSETDTSFVGARILQEGNEVWGGDAYTGHLRRY